MVNVPELRSIEHSKSGSSSHTHRNIVIAKHNDENYLSNRTQIKIMSDNGSAPISPEATLKQPSFDTKWAHKSFNPGNVKSVGSTRYK